MHAKHRNGPGNGYRPNALGMGGVAAASRVPPEGSLRGQRMYNSEYRNYNRGGYGNGGHGSGGHSKQFQPSLPPPREADIFMEAGRMAAEYLVSKGVLPPNAISGKWHNDGFKTQVGSHQSFRAHEAEKVQISADGRASALSRLGDAALDLGPGRRRYSDEYTSMDSRNSIRGRKHGSFKYYGTEVNRELGRSGSWAEKTRASPAMEADGDASVVHQDEYSARKGNSGMHNSSPAENTQEVDSGTDIETGSENCNLVEAADRKDSMISNEKGLPTDAGEPVKKSNDPDKSNDDTEVVKEGECLQQKHDENKEINNSESVASLVSEERVDLVKHSKFANVPTKARSSLTSKGSKGEEGPLNESEDISNRKPMVDSGVHIIDVDIDNSSVNASSNQNLELKSLQSDGPALENEMDITYPTRPRQCIRSGSFPERSVYKEQQPDEGLSGFGRSNSMFIDRGEKRAIDFNTDGREDFKKLRQWVPQPDAQAASSPPVSSSTENQPILQEPETLQTSHLTTSSDQNSLDISLFSKDHADPCDFMEEKQFFPSSFKTCDLNLAGASDVNENHDANPMLVFPSISRSGEVTTPIDVDLSMSNNGNLPNKNGKHGVNDKDIEVIDLEKDSAHEDSAFGNPEKRGDAAFADLDGFPNNVHNANGIQDIQDGYGLMISELLGNDSPNCSSVPTDLNSLHNHMGLPNTEENFGDDDSIYMALGEIPITSILRSWDQPTQDYGKPF